MPQIDSILIPAFGTTDFAAVAVNTSRKTRYAADTEIEYSLSFPTLLDIESEAFRFFRVPRTVFPLHVVIDREGKVVHIDNGENGIDDARTAIEDAL